MSFVKRVVLDTSTLVGAVLRPTSVPRQAFMKASAEAELCISAATLNELASVLTRNKFDRYLDLETRREFLALYRRHARLFPVTAEDEAALEVPCRDPRDNKFLALALVCSAAAIVSSDDLIAVPPTQRIA
ncbi:putative toxin-antitoxin system toxin component, PIN family [Aromatoleum aromaticum]|uniref:putative toxin-antitoxin system toxin component, PIN family n=1 Tax=Aromatoleum aromaticum TaxID=551760 RepID=UPI00145994A0|nr:putative toxin-antitoxin system toxin component, PIN family [Aromatoleum aromaticum]NMG56005.1 putative toxin-antitoxin system toxin component, PIN family [Aromatoleum aromaticum]